MAHDLWRPHSIFCPGVPEFLVTPLRRRRSRSIIMCGDEIDSEKKCVPSQQDKCRGCHMQAAINPPIVSSHQYADDTQLYIGISNLSTLISRIASIESCTQRVHDWLLNNGLHLNPSKSEAIAFYNSRSEPSKTDGCSNSWLPT